MNIEEIIHNLGMFYYKEFGLAENIYLNIKRSCRESYANYILDKYRIQNKYMIERIKHKNTKGYLDAFADLYFKEAFKNKYGVDLDERKEN